MKNKLKIFVLIVIVTLITQSCMRPQCGDIYKSGYKNPPKQKIK